MNTIEEIIREARVIAVVGLSPREDRPSFEVARYLQAHGYRIIPVNPQFAGDVILGETVLGALGDIQERVDVVDVFRQPEFVPPIVDDAITIGARAVWLQEGIVHDAASDAAKNAGLGVVMDRCMLKEHQRMEQSGSLR